MSDKPSAKTVRQLGLFTAASIVVANMIGSGIFGTSGFMAGDVGNAWVLIAGWALGGILALCGALCYAELGSMYPRVGGEYVYLREVYHPIVGFLSGWVSLTAGFSAAIAVNAHLFDAYFRSAVWDGFPEKSTGIALIWAMTALHAAHVVFGSAVQNVFTVVKISLIVFLIVAGLAVGDGSFEHFSHNVQGGGAILTGNFAVAMIFVMLSYSGWNAAAYIAGELEDPARTLPRALLLGTGIVMVLYLLLNVVYVYAAPVTGLAGNPDVGHVAAVSLFGDEWGSRLSQIIALGLVSAVSAMVMAGPRVYAAMAEDGVFFRAFARRGRGGAPMFSVILQGAIATIIVLSTALEDLMNYVGFTLSLFGALTVAGVIVLRVRDPDRPRPFLAWGYPFTPVLFIAVSLWMVGWNLWEKPTESLYGVLTVVAGFALYIASRLVNRAVYDDDAE